ARRVVMITGPRSGATDADADPIVAIELRPIYTQRSPMLDVAVAGDQLLVLSSDAVMRVDGATPANLGGRTTAPKPITTTRLLPGGVRGRLRVAGKTFEAFLPGVPCRGTIDPFTLVCADEIEPWPIGLDNSGIAPSRNAFSTPDGFVFYEVAPLDRGRFLLVSERSALTILDNGRRTAARGETADHAAPVLHS